MMQRYLSPSLPLRVRILLKTRWVGDGVSLVVVDTDHFAIATHRTNIRQERPMHSVQAGHACNHIQRECLSKVLALVVTVSTLFYVQYMMFMYIHQVFGELSLSKHGHYYLFRNKTRGFHCFDFRIFFYHLFTNTKRNLRFMKLSVYVVVCTDGYAMVILSHK